MRLGIESRTSAPARAALQDSSEGVAEPSTHTAFAERARSIATSRAW
jgi:hypothetical protein